MLAPTFSACEVAARRMAEGASRRGRIVAEVVVVGATFALLAAARALDMEWLERRFATESTHPWVLALERTILVGAALALVLVARPRLGRWVERVGPGEALAACGRYAVALVLALVASEVGLRVLDLPRRYDIALTSEALGQKDPRYGWLFKAKKTVTAETGGRLVRYDFNANHDRARTIDDLPDLSRPSILFVGESITSGHGLQWDETYPAIVGEALGLQVVNLGVEGYGPDLSFLRLHDALPRFERPVAIVWLFLPGLVDRVERVDHQRISFDGDDVKLEDPGFFQGLRLTQALRESFELRAEWAIQTTAEVFRRAAAMAKARGAKIIFVTPYLGCNWPRSEDYLVDELVRKQGFVAVDPHFGFQGIPHDQHPDAPSTRRLAEAVIATLRTELAAP